MTSLTVPILITTARTPTECMFIALANAYIEGQRQAEFLIS